MHFLDVITSKSFSCSTFIYSTFVKTHFILGSDILFSPHVICCEIRRTPETCRIYIQLEWIINYLWMTIVYIYIEQQLRWGLVRTRPIVTVRVTCACPSHHGFSILSFIVIFSFFLDLFCSLSIFLKCQVCTNMAVVLQLLGLTSCFSNQRIKLLKNSFNILRIIFFAE